MASDAKPVFLENSKCLKILLEASNARLSPLEDPLLTDYALHKWLKIPPEKVFNNLDRYGNTSAGSIPLALDEALAAGRLKRGQLALFSGFGAGLAWGTALVRW